MKAYNIINAKSVEEATEALKKTGSIAVAGGGDVIPALKDNIFPEYPRLVVNIMSIPKMSNIEVVDGVLQIGALAILADIAENPLVAENATALSMAAAKCASPNLRQMTTIGGNICQMPRCWYFRKLNNVFNCARKGSKECFAVAGDNRYHSIFGAETFTVSDQSRHMCIAVNQSECAPALLALDAIIVTDKRKIPIGDFFACREMSSTVLEKNEIIIRIDIKIDKSRKSIYKRFSYRKSIDFPVVNFAISVSESKEYKIFLGGVAPVPREAVKSEELLCGKCINEEIAGKAADAAVEGAKPTDANDYKVDLLKTLIYRELMCL